MARTTPKVELPFRGAGLVAMALAALGVVGAGCSSTDRVMSRPVAEGEAGAAAAPRAEVAVVTPDDGIAETLEDAGDDVKVIHAHLTTLANPWFEGRAPGTAGIERAAAYIEDYFVTFGLEPAFPEVITAPGGEEVIEANRLFRQEFSAPGDTVVNDARASWSVESEGEERELVWEDDFNPMAFGANGEVEGGLVFAGYAIGEGPEDYSSFGPHDDLTGKIAIVLRFEPMSGSGRSLWSDNDSWTYRAGLMPKMEAVVERGAAGVILVNAPGADDSRMSRLMSVQESSRIGSLEAPVIMLTTDAADDLVRAADVEGRSLMELRRLADSGEAKSIELPRARFRMTVDTEKSQIPTENIGGVLRGRGNLADEYIVIGAHYDHIGFGVGRSTRSPDHRGEVHAGADDNASGTSGLLLLAQRLSERYEELPDHANARSILFLAFSAEEMGLLGARHFVRSPSIDLSRVQAMLNMDMIGRLRSKQGLEISGAGTGDRMRGLIEPIVARSGINASIRESGAMPSDQAAFLEVDVPVLGFFTGTHREYHTVHDVGSTVNFAGAAAVARLVGEIAFALATTDERLAYHAISGGRGQTGSLRGVTVRLGIAPGDYADDTPGVLVGSVSPDTTAAQGGMKAGDRIIRWGGEELADVQAMMGRLAGHKPGDKVTVVVLRDGQEVPLELVMQPRSGAR